MYVMGNLRKRTAEKLSNVSAYEWKNDKKVFELSLSAAVEMLPLVIRRSEEQGLDETYWKQHGPVACATTTTTKPVASIQRKELNKVSMRSFIIGDMDCDDVDESEAARARLIEWAEAGGVYLLIYPTISYPAKPHWRWVVFAVEPMEADEYARSVAYMYREVLGTEAPDKGDYDIKMTRNLPFFCNSEQAAAVWSNLDKDGKPLDNELWAGIEAPTTKKRTRRASAKIQTQTPPEAAKKHKRQYSFPLLIMSAEQFGRSHISSDDSVGQFWKFVTSLAAAVIYAGVDIDDARGVLDVIAHVAAAGDKVKEAGWRQGNESELDKQIQLLTDDPARIEDVRPLYMWREFSRAAVIG